MKKLFVGSLAWATKDDSLRAFFEQFGVVASATVVTERDNPSRSRGFGFVEFENDEDADRAIAEADGKELDGRNITVSEAQSKERSQERMAA
jgi:RNA recognition motif-containing protein